MDAHRDAGAMKIMITGGLGYIGSHVAALLASLSHRDALRAEQAADGASSSTSPAWANVSVADDAMQQRYALHIVDIADPDAPAAKALAAVLQHLNAVFTFHRVDIRDADALHALFGAVRPDCVLHLAALKSVSESIRAPLQYYHTNVLGTHNLLHAMSAHECFHLVYSSSSCVYGSAMVPYDEDRAVTGTGITNPYGRTKHVAEQLIADVVESDSRWRAVALRYFNPIGAHPSARIGEHFEPRSLGLMPSIVRSLQHGTPFTINGTDYAETPDGTPVRDFLHIMDLAEAHRAAIVFICRNSSLMYSNRFEAINLGTGHGYSVLEVIRCMERVSGQQIPIIRTQRRPGDIPMSISSVRKAIALLQWRSECDLEDMCTDVLRFHGLLPTRDAQSQ